MQEKVKKQENHQKTAKSSKKLDNDLF